MPLFSGTHHLLSYLQRREEEKQDFTEPFVVYASIQRVSGRTYHAREEHLMLTTRMFQHMFPSIDVNTVKLSLCQRIVLIHYNKDTKRIDFRHYSIRLQPVGVSRRLRKFVQNHQVPDLRNLQDVSDFVTRVNRASTKSAVKLQEIGPRMTLELVKIEDGMCSGHLLFSSDGWKRTKKKDEGGGGSRVRIKGR
uniref:Brix domain-containing protein n=1 Tax=Chenopodium quinoa TaxID=63459 RepID=A0A803MPF1_CHEQI